MLLYYSKPNKGTNVVVSKRRTFVFDLIRFCLVGILSITAQFLTLAACVEWFQISPTPSSALGFMTGCGVNYLLLYYWAFTSDGHHHILFFRYLTVMACTMALNVFIFWIFTEALGVWYIFSQSIATTCSAFFSFLFNRHYTFV